MRSLLICMSLLSFFAFGDSDEKNSFENLEGYQIYNGYSDPCHPYNVQQGINALRTCLSRNDVNCAQIYARNNPVRNCPSWRGLCVQVVFQRNSYSSRVETTYASGVAQMVCTPISQPAPAPVPAPPPYHPPSVVPVPAPGTDICARYTEMNRLDLCNNNPQCNWAVGVGCYMKRGMACSYYNRFGLYACNNAGPCSWNIHRYQCDEK